MSFASCISVEISNSSVDKVDSILALVTEKSDTVDFQLASTVDSAAVAQLCKKASVGLVDPSAESLGSSCTACMTSDRKDGLFATVVCTRTSEALGLEYSSKVCRRGEVDAIVLLAQAYRFRLHLLGIHCCSSRIRRWHLLLPF